VISATDRRERSIGAPISVTELRVTYQAEGEPLTAIESATMDVGAGEFVSIIGPSGCGKSTLLKTIGGLIAATSGEVRVGEITPDEARRLRMFGVVFQEPVLMAWRTNLDNVLLPLEVLGIPRAERHERGVRALDQVGLSEFAHRYPRQLSGGMRQRVAIARALALEPQVLLMDEPFGALDELTRGSMNAELQDLWLQTRKTVVFITHSIREAVFLSDRVFVMSNRPATLKSVIEIDVPRPRRVADRESAEYSGYASLIGAELGL
jgi:NitT/TauT family transport system ATP-binding protein